MAYFNSIYFWFLCIISLKSLQSAKIYVIDFPVAGDSDSKDYDDYGVHYENNIRHTYKTDEMDANQRANIVMCERLFGSIYENREKHIRCLEALKKKPHGHVGRQQYKPFLDLTGFSQDYLDVNDLARSEFAGDYVDVNDFKGVRNVIPECNEEFDEFGQITKNNCLPASRKALAIDEDSYFTVKAEDLKVDKGNILRKKRHKRYKVVSNESDKSESDESVSSDESYKSGDNSDVNDNAGSVSSIQNSDSIEATTKKPKKNNKKSKREYSDAYLYLQGNKLYDKDDFRRNKLQLFRAGDIGNDDKNHRSRRRLRMTHFLPKRYHWDEDDFQKLGYYWFNGPRGKYKSWNR